jgi:hypothetical protein
LNDLLRHNKKALLFRIVCILGVALAVTPAIQAFSEALPDYPGQAPGIAYQNLRRISKEIRRGGYTTKIGKILSIHTKNDSVYLMSLFPRTVDIPCFAAICFF